MCWIVHVQKGMVYLKIVHIKRHAIKNSRLFLLHTNGALHCYVHVSGASNHSKLHRRIIISTWVTCVFVTMAFVVSLWTWNLGLRLQTKRQNFILRNREKLQGAKSIPNSHSVRQISNLVLPTLWSLTKVWLLFLYSLQFSYVFNKLPLCHFIAALPSCVCLPSISHSLTKSNRLLTAHLLSDETVHVSAFIHKIIKLRSKLFQSFRNSRSPTVWLGAPDTRWMGAGSPRLEPEVPSSTVQHERGILIVS